ALAFCAWGPVLDEVGEAEVGAGAGSAKTDGETKTVCCGGTISGEAGIVAARDDATILHVADKDFGSLRQADEEVLEIIQFTADAGAQAVVDEERNLGSVG